MTNYTEKAKALFHEGYNCAQAVVLAFSDLTGLDERTAVMLSSSFGGGIGRMREVCGAVSGMCMVAGLLYGYDDPKAQSEKALHYARVQQLAADFRNENGSIICHELLGLGGGASVPIPEQRTQSYYKKRPCAELVSMAAGILEEYIRNNPID